MLPRFEFLPIVNLERTWSEEGYREAFLWHEPTPRTTRDKWWLDNWWESPVWLRAWERKREHFFRAVKAQHFSCILSSFMGKCFHAVQRPFISSCKGSCFKNFSPLTKSVLAFVTEVVAVVLFWKDKKGIIESLEFFFPCYRPATS